MDPLGVFVTNTLAATELILPSDGIIRRVDWVIRHTVADGGLFDWQLSFLQTTVFTTQLTNNVSVIAYDSATIELTTSGAAIGRARGSIDGIDLEVQSGERLYSFMNVTTITAECACLVWIDRKGAGVNRPATRRRLA